MKVNRRTIVKGMVAGFLAARAPMSAQGPESSASAEKNFRIWDVHSHLEALPGNTPEERMEILVRDMDRLGIERLMLSQGFGEFEMRATPEQIRIENNRIVRAVKHAPGRAYGSLFLNPRNGASCLEEFDRCIRDGPMVMIGELETDVRCNSPLLDPIVERAVSMGVPILQHTWTVTLGDGPDDSRPADLVELAARHPEANFICGHTGGNWELGIRTIRNSKISAPESRAPIPLPVLPKWLSVSLVPNAWSTAAMLEAAVLPRKSQKLSAPKSQSKQKG